MAKEQYQIPSSLDVSYFDMEFNLKSKNGVGFSKPVSAKVIVMTGFAGFGLFAAISRTFIGKGGIPLIIGFALSYIILSVLLIRADATKRTGLELVFSMLNYLPKSGRRVATRLTDNVYSLKMVTNINHVDPEDGLIYFLDGQIGYAYHVVGSASVLMFEEDKNAILDKVDAFYRKLPVGSEVIFDTLYEGHNVEKQLRSAHQEIENLGSDSPGLQALLDEKVNVLDYAINESEQLTSLHQYLIVRAPNESMLRDVESIIIGDVENEGLMFRLITQLNYQETARYLRSVFNPPKQIVKASREALREQE